MDPHVSSIANVLAHYGCNDAEFADFISELLQNDPEMRPTAEQALSHPWLLGSSGACAPYVLSDHLGEAAEQMQSKYPSMRDSPEPQIPGQENEAVGPVTPTSFRERGGKKVVVVKKCSQKSDLQQTGGLSSALPADGGSGSSSSASAQQGFVQRRRGE